jgi:hypothetical protein
MGNSHRRVLLVRSICSGQHAHGYWTGAALNFGELREGEVRATPVRRTYPRCVWRGLTLLEQEPSETPDETNLRWLTLSILPH